MKILVPAVLVSLLLVLLAPPAPTPADGQPQAIACPNTVAISTTANVQLVAKGADNNKWIRICAFVVVATAAEIVSLIEGKGTACATEPEPVIGSITAANGMSLAANAVLPMIATSPFAKTAYDDNNLCLAKDVADRVSGFLSYVVM